MNITLEANNPSFKYKETQRIFGIDNKDRIIFEYNEWDTAYEGVTFISGCSGSGKTTFGKQLANKQGFHEIPKTFNKDIPIIDVLDKDFKESVYYLNMVGLCEPYLYLTSYKKLSTGQQFRFDVAYAISLGQKKIIIDEFCSYLDRFTAKIVSYNTQKLLRKLNISAILISAHDDVIEYLIPDNIINLSLNSEVEIQRNLRKGLNSQLNPFSEKMVIEQGDYNDYLNLEKYHYFDHSSEEINNSFNSTYFKMSIDGEIMGIIMFKDPYSNIQDDEEFVELSKEVKVLSRIILHPIVRGVGLSKEFFNRVHKLINYCPLYVCSALAEYIPFFEKMGFQEIEEYNYTTEKEYVIIQKYIADSSMFDEKTVLKALEVMLGKITYWQHKTWISLTDKESKYTLEDFKGFFTNVYEIEDIHFLIEEVTYFKMKHYVMKSRGYNGTFMENNRSIRKH